MKNVPYKIYLSEEEMPTKWYNVRGTAAESRHRKAPHGG